MSHKKRNVFLHWPIWLAYLVLAVVGIPWYWPAESSRVLMGMPVWALVSLGASLVCSLFTAWLLLRFWPDSEGGE